ncbi:MAG: S1 family peptidase [Anaerolineae bacterium]|nr:S1 family peptidase [Anaerolineae bacterium]
MSQNNSTMMLSEAGLKEIDAPLDTATAELLDIDAKRPLANVIGVGAGVKWKDGKPKGDGEPSIIVLVTQKLDLSQVPKADRIPKKIADAQTDVLAIGQPFAGGRPSSTVGTQTLAQRIRPAEGGYSVGHVKITAGTIATCAYDILNGGKASPPEHGIGIPSRYYILSNNHVLANSNDANLGDPILQPGPYDGGSYPQDVIARLSRFIPITFDPPVSRENHRNLVDAAIAEGDFHDLDREIYWVGYTRGWRPKDMVKVGTLVQKTGRTTNYTVGRITAIKATVDVGYGGGRVARFRDQIITTDLSAGGDSGSLVTTLDNIAVGLLFAGSSIATIVNQIENVRNLLRVEVAEQIL